MADNLNLSAARTAKNDEFYTQYEDIEAEMNAYVEYNPDVFRDKTILLPCDDPDWSNFTLYFEANFKRYGIRKLISTSYAKSSGNERLTSAEQDSPLFDAEKRMTHGRLFVMTRDDQEDKFSGYLQGDGDFRSAEVTALRDEADVIITNPPFSLFREFLAWIQPEKRKFCIIGNQNAITYKEVFPLLKNNTIWLGAPFIAGNAYFFIPNTLNTAKYADGVFDAQKGLVKFRNCKWYTNLDHGMRHEPLLLDTMAHNLKYNKKLRHKLENAYGKIEYPHYDNYDALEVPFTECIPSDYDGVMGVPITFMDKYSPEQFEIIGNLVTNNPEYFSYGVPYCFGRKIYARILIHPKKGGASA